MSSSASPSRGWVVTFAGTGLNLALGVLYSWSVIAKKLTKTWGWSAADASLPYAVACGVFAIIMVFAGLALTNSTCTFLPAPTVPEPYRSPPASTSGRTS